MQTSPLLAAAMLCGVMLTAGCGHHAPTFQERQAQRDEVACAAYGEVPGLVERINATPIPELAREQAALAASRAATSGDGASPELAGAMSAAADTLSRLGDAIGDVDMTAPGGPVPPFPVEWQAVNDSMAAVDRLCP